MRSNKLVLRILLGLLSTLMAVGPSASAGAAGNQSEERFFVVGFRDMPRTLRPGQDLYGARVERVDRVLHFARVSTTNPSQFQSQATTDGRVRYVEADPLRKLIEFVPNDPRFNEQYGPQQVSAREAWDTTLGDLDATVCIVDTGVRYTHVDLAGSRWLGGFDFVNNDADPMDDNGHGTHVAGSAAATINNATSIAGMANVGIRAVKVLNSSGSGSWSQVASGIRWCADNGGPRTVISMSLGGGVGEQVLKDAVVYAQGKGALQVAAAGNGGPCNNCIGYPAKYPEVIAVTCTNNALAQCSFSSDGPESELAAPGQSILSLWNTSDTATNTISGTSMSTPHVSGAAALVWSHVTGLTNAQLRQLLRNNAQDLGPGGWDEQFGYGEVDAKRTLDAAINPPPPESRVSFEDFNDGVADGWTQTGLWHVSQSCSPLLEEEYLAYNRDPSCNYNTGARNSGTATFDVNLGGATAASLNFSERYQVESFTPGAYDIMRVEISSNGGATWTTLRQRDSRNSAQSSWTNSTIDLDAYVGGPRKIRFFFDTVDGQFNNFPGWFVENVEVTAASAGNLPPIANAGPDQTVADDDGSGDEAVSLDGTGSTDSDGTIVSYEWREGGSLIGTGPTPTVTFPVGSHTVTLTVTDDDTDTDSDDVIVTVNANRVPTAAFVFSTSSLTVNVDGSGSSDPDGTIASYSWEWGDGSPPGSGVTASHTYAAPGTYTVTLTVTDNGGASDSEAKAVTVGQAPLVSEDFNDGVADGWARSGLWHVSMACAPILEEEYLGYNEDADCQYSTGARTTGSASFDVDLTGQTEATLRFSERYQVESFSLGAYDIMRVEISTNGGATWTTLRQRDSRNPAQASWTNSTIDLDAYVGGPRKIRFFFDSVDGRFNNFPGWFLDDVEVTAP